MSHLPDPSIIVLYAKNNSADWIQLEKIRELIIPKAPSNVSTIIHILYLPEDAKGENVQFQWKQENLRVGEVYEACWALDNILVINSAHRQVILEDSLDPVDTGNWLFFPGATVKHPELERGTDGLNALMVSLEMLQLPAFHKLSLREELQRSVKQIAENQGTIDLERAEASLKASNTVKVKLIPKDKGKAYQADFIPSATTSLQAGIAQMPNILIPTKRVASKNKCSGIHWFHQDYPQFYRPSILLARISLKEHFITANLENTGFYSEWQRQKSYLDLLNMHSCQSDGNSIYFHGNEGSEFNFATTRDVDLSTEDIQEQWSEEFESQPTGLSMKEHKNSDPQLEPYHCCDPLLPQWSLSLSNAEFLLQLTQPCSSLPQGSGSGPAYGTGQAKPLQKSETPNDSTPQDLLTCAGLAPRLSPLACKDFPFAHS
ncbi:hypothetical protein P7K49_025448 [Saguinus oedipus]|uniref:Reelin n=1 Tax=Saguinus oedipus TaxID=9490 RepID=A0ABQ9UHY4_SAGOE|nr:hypothetical protein P7K49_025448 [Saguinus oedipus]